MAVFQDASPPGALAQVIAARSSLLILAAPIGTALSAPLVASLGARRTLLVSALATITLGLITAALLAPTATTTTRPGPHPPRYLAPPSPRPTPACPVSCGERP